MNKPDISALQQLIKDLQARIAQQDRKINELQSLVRHYHEGTTPIHSVREQTQYNKKSFKESVTALFSRRPLFTNSILERVVSMFIVALLACIVIAGWWGFDQALLLYGVGLAAFALGIYLAQLPLVVSAYGVWFYATVYSFYSVLFYPELLLFSPLLFYATVAMGLFCFGIAAFFMRQEQHRQFLLLGICLLLLLWIFAISTAKSCILIALLIYGLTLLWAGSRYNHKLLRQCAYAVSVCFMVMFAHYLVMESFLDNQLFFSFNVVCVLTIFACIVAYEIVSRFKNQLTVHEQFVVSRMLEMAMICVGFIWLRAYIIMRFNAAEKPGLILARIWGDYDVPTDLIRSAKTNNALAAFYLMYAFVVMGASFILHNRWFGHLAMVFLLIASIKLVMVMGTISGYGIAVAFGGVVLFAVMYGYRVMRGRY